uniref:AB hydrolase-1 domain-containing protein n=2 Tax=Chloropicon primus TaxID=1764295 RepID=A0A7S2X0P5_9CHLO
MEVHELCAPRRGNEGEVLTVLMLHCAGFHGRVYRRIATALRDKFEGEVRVLAPDFRGHGDTAAGDESSFTWYQMARDLVEIVKSENVEGKAVVLGHSLGAVVGLIAEIENPGIFRGVWCFEPVLFADVNGLKYSQFFSVKARGRKSTFASHQEAFENFRTKRPTKLLDTQCLRDYVWDGFRARGNGGVELKCAPEVEARTYLAGFETFKRGINEELKDITCPVVLACGSNVGAENVVSQNADLFAGKFRRGRLERYGDLGHFGPFEQPEFVAERLLTFIREDVAGGPSLPRYMHWNLSWRSKL